jgi:sugar/nucleoside kinase (ribokinase family)
VLLFDASHTSHTRAQTGIQRVTRALFAELAKVRPATAVCHDPYLGAWRPLGAGTAVRYLGALGRPEIHPLFRDFARRTQAVSLCAPAHTTALEFQDGKLMLGTMASFDEITYPRLVEVLGEGALWDALARADLVALANWTMIPHMTEIFDELVSRVFPSLPPRERVFFFDLADPEKRPESDLRAALAMIARFQNFGRAILGLNLKEGQQVHRLLGFAAQPETETGLREMARAIRQRLQIAVVVIHPRDCAACATREDTWCVPGPYIEKPLITTGAGDHFNAGFASAQLLGLSPQSSLALGVVTSGFYVRHARSPSLGEILAFLKAWT